MLNVSVTHPTTRPNFCKVRVNNLVIWFSYHVPIAFDTSSTGLVVRENSWSNTTGKHLDYIDDGRKSDRLTYGEFERQFAIVTGKP